MNALNHAMKTIPFSHVREFYDRNRPEGHWFDRDTLRFFKSKLPTSAYETDAGVLFVSRETNPSGITAFTVRRQMVDGDIKTVGEFHHFPTAADARAQIKRLHLGTTL